jgi:preprotein translocase subunit SecD
VSRYFAVLAVILVGLYLLVFLTGNKKPDPKLGLDLQGGTSLTLAALTPDGKDPNSASLEQARQIIANRVNGSGVAEPEVVTEGRRNIVVNVAGGASEDELKKLVAPAKLAFRKVLSSAQDHPATPAPSGSASASASSTASKSPTPSASASKSPSAAPSSAAPSSAAPSGSTSATPSASVNPSQSAAAAAKAQTLDQVKAKLGPAYTLAQGIQDPTQVNAQTLAAVAPFGQLSPQEVAALPAQLQFLVPTVTCAQLNARDPGALDDPNAQVVACDQGDNVHNKYFLDIAKVQGTDVATADNSYDAQNGGWHVTLHFKSSGQDKWTKLTQEAMQNANSSSGTSSGGAQVAVVLDNQVVSAPQIQSVISGDAIINGTGINQTTSKTLATQLRYGSLPLNFKIENTQAVTATLGLQQMRYGLLAGAIGLILVVLYCLFYYRALGLVVIASLAVSGLTVFASLVLLGRSLGFTLSLAGIAGFIVAIGITADSFVVFFERLKDEVKDGRTVRSAVPRAWHRAQRTILSADAVSFLAAVVLYFFASGPVKGFAFTLGMSTIIDLLVVFTFTHPLVALLSRWSAFTSPRISGLGNARPDSAAETAGSRSPRLGTMRTKES